MKYIVAVSGGVDSVALLHMLYEMQRNQPHLELVVAHADHGIREDSASDKELVENLAERYGLPFVCAELGLPSDCSEEVARAERYKWLEKMQREYRADAVVTAHHQDDQIETIMINLLRGTGWRGLASLRTTDERFRPLLDLPKAHLVRYAIDHDLEWREDSTNDDVRYLRNYIRQGYMGRLPLATRQQLSGLAAKQRRLRDDIETEIAVVLESVRDEVGLHRYNLIMLPDAVALEVLRLATKGEVEPTHLRRLLHFVKTGRQGAVLNLGKGRNALLTKRSLIV